VVPADGRDWVRVVRVALTAVADPARAEPMAAYMKGIAPFLGVAAPQRRAAVRPLGQPPQDVIASVARELWAEPEREFAYVAADWIVAASKTGPVSLLNTVEALTVTKSWWDSVDSLVHATGHMVERFPDVAPRVEQWVTGENFWLARSAILHQLGFGDRTNTERLERFCLARADDPEFFIRKAIGWALRDYAWRNPSWVEEFVNRHRSVLSALTIREATKNLTKASKQPIGTRKQR
jgi:3-methyladenine DNA glycosylase AlkD